MSEDLQFRLAIAFAVWAVFSLMAADFIARTQHGEKTWHRVAVVMAILSTLCFVF